MKLPFRFASVLVITLTVTAACGGPSEEPAETIAEEDIAMSDTDAPPGVTVTDGRLTLPAVAGNPGAAYFTIANAGETDLSIRAVSVTGAENAMLHETMSEGGQAQMQGVEELLLPSGEEVALEPGGLHVMAMGLDEGLREGGEIEVTLTFANGDKVSFPVAILAPGMAGASN